MSLSSFASSMSCRVGDLDEIAQAPAHLAQVHQNLSVLRRRTSAEDHL